MMQVVHEPRVNGLLGERRLHEVEDGLRARSSRQQQRAILQLDALLASTAGLQVAA